MPKFVKGGPNPGFKPGQSGNPKGRTKSILEVAAAARDFSLEGLEILKKIARKEDGTDAARAMAVNSILDRGLGKPLQTVDLNQREYDAREMKEYSDDELTSILAGDEPVAETNGSAGAADTPPDPPVPH
jgi:Family of unknown function (DUF5681)